MKLFKSIIVLAITLIATQAFSASIVVNPKFQAIDEDGAPLVGGCLYSYDCGTTSKAATCADYLCAADNTNPIELDARGEADVYSDQCFKLALYVADIDGVCDTTPSTTLIWTKDNIPPDNDGTATDGTTVLSLGTDGTDAYFIGDIQADDGTEVLENGTDGTDSTYIGDIYATNGISLILDSGTDGTNAIFTGDVTGDVTGAVTGAVTGDVAGDLTGDVTGGIVETGTAGAVINVKVIEMGDWNMATTSNVAVAHGVTSSKIRGVQALVRNDDDSGTYSINFENSAVATGQQGVDVLSTNVEAQRKTSGFFDSADFDSTTYNRGWFLIWYTD